VLELELFAGGIVGCFGRAAALDSLAGSAELPLRVAPTELLLLGEQRRLREFDDGLRALDPDGLALDLSSAYATWAVRGDDRFEAFARLSAFPLPEPGGFAQGLVAHVPAKVVVRRDDLLVVVSSVVSHHLRERLSSVCRGPLAETMTR
jgi:hypothetical protein